MACKHTHLCMQADPEVLRTHLHGIAKDIAATVHTARPESVSSEDEDAEEGEEEKPGCVCV